MSRYRCSTRRLSPGTGRPRAESSPTTLSIYPFGCESLPVKDQPSIADLLAEVAETHHRVYRITDGADDDWASWYADWLLDRSELPDVLHARPVRSHLVHALVQLDRDYTAAGIEEPWPAFYERGLRERFSSS
jgi:hypothetical protein